MAATDICFIPGDEIIYNLVFLCKANIRSVKAEFRNEDSGNLVVLIGEAQLIEKPRVVNARTFEVALTMVESLSDELVTGRYRSNHLSVETYAGYELDFDNPVEQTFYFEEEDPDMDLPRLARGIVEPAAMFLLPVGHPNTPPS